MEVIKNLGRDGFPLPYYKAFAATLAPYMARFFNAKTRGDPLDLQLNYAFITVIPKPDKDPGVVGKYRPIPICKDKQRVHRCPPYTGAARVL